MRLLLLAICLAATPPTAHAQELRNGQQASFGAITMDPITVGSPAPTPVEARITLWNLGPVQAANDILVGLDLPSPHAHGDLVGLFAADGTEVPMVADFRDVRRQPNIRVHPDDLAAHADNGTVELVLKGTAWADEDGSFQVGALFLAMRDGEAVVLRQEGPDGEPVDERVQLYAFTQLGVDGTSGPGDPPFVGQGNTAVAWLPAILGALCVVALVVPWPKRRPKPTVFTARPAAAPGPSHDGYSGHAHGHHGHAHAQHAHGHAGQARAEGHQGPGSEPHGSGQRNP